jgi:hypothetical protein
MHTTPLLQVRVHAKMESSFKAQVLMAK